MAAILSGCASGPLGGEALMGGIKSSAARLVIYRTSALGFAVQPNYLIGGKVIGGSQPAGFIACDLTPGRHEVAVNNMPLSSILFGRGSEKVSVDLHAGSTAYLSAEPQMGLVTPGQITHAAPGDGKPGPQRRREPASDHQCLRQRMMRSRKPSRCG